MPAKTPPPLVLTVAEMAHAQDVTPQTIRRYLRRGVLGGRKIGSTWVVWWPDVWGRPPAHAHKAKR